MQKLTKRISLVMVALMTVFTALSYMPANAAVAKIPQVQYAESPKTEYTVGDRVSFNLYAPNYGGRVQYRVVLWQDETKSYKDLWTTGDKYYANWQPYGNNIFTLGWPINEPGHYRITIYVKRAGIANNMTFIPSANCDSFMESDSFVVKAKGTTVEEAKTVITAKNNTTVEVAFTQEMTGAKAEDYSIEGLKVVNAAVKQTDKKVVILTTESQKDATEYTVKYNSKEIGKFKGIGAVVVKAVEIVNPTNSLKVGEQNVLQAKVTPANDTDKKDGIEVTLNVTNTNGTLNPAVIKTAVTDANGVATFEGYTRYAAGKDSVAVYATGTPVVRAMAAAYWGVKDILTITPSNEVTVNNRAVQYYTVTLTDPTTGIGVANAPINVTFAENIDQPTANDTTAVATDANNAANTRTPYESVGIATPLVIRTNALGVAAFTVTGINTVVTPVVYADDIALGLIAGNGDNRVNPMELQKKLGKVSFFAVQQPYKVTMTQKTASEGAVNNAVDYEVTVTLPDGKPYIGGIVNFGFEELLDNSFMTTTNATFVQHWSTLYPFQTALAGNTVVAVRLDKDGKASVSVNCNAVNSSATPRAWLDLDAVGGVGSINNRYEAGEPSDLGGTVTFRPEYLHSANIWRAVSLREANLTSTTDVVTYRYRLRNQSLVEVTPAVQARLDRVTFTVTNTSSSIVTLTPVPGTNYVLDNAAPFTLIPGESRTVAGTVTVAGQVRAEIQFTQANPSLAYALSVSAVGTGFVGTTPVSYAAAAVNNNWIPSQNILVADLTAGTEYTGEVVRFSTDDNFVVVKLDGQADRHVRINYAPNNLFYVGTNADFMSLASANEGIFESALSIGDRIKVVGAGAANLVQVRLFNKDNSFDTTQPTLTPAGVVGAVANTVTYAAATAATPAAYTSSPIIATLGGDITVGDGANTVAVVTTGLGSAQAVVDAINAAIAAAPVATRPAIAATVVNGNQVRLTSTVTGAAAAAAVTVSTAAAVFPVATVNGTNLTPARAAQYTFDITTSPEVGERVIVGGVTYTVIAGVPAIGTNQVQYDAAPATFAANLAAQINAGTVYNAAAVGATITLTQKVAAAGAAPTVSVEK